jgi:regulatory protein
MTRNDAFNAALRLLKTRERSEKELASRLQRKGFEAEVIVATVDRCREYGYIDDARFARCKARQLLTSGRAVGGRLRRELQLAGVGEELAEQTLTALKEDFSEETLLSGLLERRFSSFNYGQADDREKRRVVNYFLRRGFALAMIMNQLKKQV